MNFFFQWLRSNETAIIIFAVFALFISLLGFVVLDGAARESKIDSNYIEVNGKACEITVVCVD